MPKAVPLAFHICSVFFQDAFIILSYPSPCQLTLPGSCLRSQLKCHLSLGPPPSPIVATSSLHKGLFMLFFVLSGAELDFSILATVGLAGVIYIISRSFGKYSGAFVGAAISKADPNVRKYLGITLLPQAGVAIGMAQMVAASPNLTNVAPQVVTVALFATLVYELVGPVLTKIALTKAGEIQKQPKPTKKKVQLEA